MVVCCIDCKRSTGENLAIPLTKAKIAKQKQQQQQSNTTMSLSSRADKIFKAYEEWMSLDADAVGLVPITILKNADKDIVVDGKEEEKQEEKTTTGGAVKESGEDGIEKDQKKEKEEGA